MAPLLPCDRHAAGPTGRVRRHRDEKNLDDMGTGKGRGVGQIGAVAVQYWWQLSDVLE